MKKLFIVEDDTVVGFVYRTFLEKNGFEIQIATDGMTGLARILETCPDCILLDLMLPKMGGVEILKRLRALESFAKTPIIVFTNAFVPALVDEAVKAGATKVFNKLDTKPHMILQALQEAAGEI